MVNNQKLGASISLNENLRNNESIAINERLNKIELNVDSLSKKLDTLIDLTVNKKSFKYIDE